MTLKPQNICGRLAAIRGLPLIAGLSLIAIPAMIALSATAAQAAPSCTVSTVSINFGTSSVGTGNIDFSCVDLPNGNNFVCVTLGTASAPGTPSQPKMANGAHVLDFDLYKESSRVERWISGQLWRSNLRGRTMFAGSIPFYGEIRGGQHAPAGAYFGQFVNTTLMFSKSGSCNNPFSTRIVNVDVQATVMNRCSIQALGVADMGAVLAMAGGASGTTAIRVNCPSGTLYSIGLTPSNGNTMGQGVLSGAASNPDKPTYQLRRNSVTGPAWGQAVSATNTGNGVSASGNGADQTIPVYVTAPSSNYTPDQYTDTVTVTLHY